MTRQAMSLLDVLSPPGNDWLKEISRRRSELPNGVRVVRFGDNEDETHLDDDRVAGKLRKGAKAA